MTETSAGTTKRITIEEGKITIESNDKTWLDFIKTEILNSERAPKSNAEMAKKFVNRCWRKPHMRNVIKTLTHNRKVTFEDITNSYKKEFSKTRGLSGVMSGLTRNARRTGLPKSWVHIEHNGIHWTYSISETLYETMRAEALNLEKIS